MKQSHHLNIVLGSTCVIFHWEIGLLQKCDIWSRVLGWDGKWVYIVSYFVSPHPQNAGSDQIPKQEDILACIWHCTICLQGRAKNRRSTRRPDGLHTSAKREERRLGGD